MPNESPQFSAMKFFIRLPSRRAPNPRQRIGHTYVSSQCPSNHTFMPTQSGARLPSQTAMDYPKFPSRSRAVVMCVYDETGNVS
jgi:hypothetical protein